MFFTSLLISLPYSPVRVTSRDGDSLNFTKTFYIMLRFTRIVRPGPSFFSSIFQHLQGSPYLHSSFQAALCTPCKGVVHLYSSTYIVRLHSTPHTRGYRVNLWIVFFSFALAGAKTPLQCIHWLIKAPPPFASALFTGRTAKAVVNWLQSSHDCICFCCFSLFVAFAF